ncbi:hypothetical protein AVEN_88103-1 [Araneus ventricosus]|uniref:Uncharacterized protein n=1 Tax=Araneus ventricosus TaxID=182803 RepID=A0A4Y2KUG0_ARAVE|nr:hypothetical protein AVEN_88103-1 [Araneus ventricosus]
MDWNRAMENDQLKETLNQAPSTVPGRPDPLKNDRCNSSDTEVGVLTAIPGYGLAPPINVGEGRGARCKGIVLEPEGSRFETDSTERSVSLGLLHVKSFLGTKRPPSGVVRKFGESIKLRRRLCHLTSINSAGWIHDTDLINVQKDALRLPKHREEHAVESSTATVHSKKDRLRHMNDLNRTAAKI